MVSLFHRRSASRVVADQGGYVSAGSPSATLERPGEHRGPAPADLSGLTGEWMVDPGHSRIGFSVRHAMVTTVRGAFTRFEGRLLLDGSRPERSRAEVSVEIDSVDTGVEQRDAHITGPDFLDAAAYPRMTFTSTGVEVSGPDTYRMAGELTLRDVTRPVVLDLAFLGHVIDPFGYERAGFDGTTTINRVDWGLTYNNRLADGGALVSERVRLQLDLAAIRSA
jgi:polyisoprenoid-binding protein YceI